MADIIQQGTPYSINEQRLIGEAIRRATAARAAMGTSRDAIEAAVMAEAGRGTRSMFGLVRAASRIGDGQPAR